MSDHDAVTSSFCRLFPLILFFSVVLRMTSLDEVMDFGLRKGNQNTVPNYRMDHDLLCSAPPLGSGRVALVGGSDMTLMQELPPSGLMWDAALRSGDLTDTIWLVMVRLPRELSTEHGRYRGTNIVYLGKYKD